MFHFKASPSFNRACTRSYLAAKKATRKIKVLKGNIMNNSIDKKVLIIGAGLAGSDAAYYLAERGISVVLLESKTLNPNPAQKLKNGAELVCTNSLKSQANFSAHGLLKKEMKALG